MEHFAARPLPVRQCLRPDRRQRADVVASTAHLPAVLMGLRWLYDTVQPSDAVVDPHRHKLPSTRGCRALRFDPVGCDGAVTIELLAARYRVRDNALAAAELAALGELVDELGEEVVHSWIGRSGQGGIVGGLMLARPAHPSLLAGAARFAAGATTAGAPAIGLAAVRQAVLEREVSLQQFAGPWPESLDPSGLLSRVAGRALAQLASGPVSAADPE